MTECAKLAQNDQTAKTKRNGRVSGAWTQLQTGKKSNRLTAVTVNRGRNGDGRSDTRRRATRRR